MLKQALDFKNESDCLFKIMEGLSETEFGTQTLFKNWSFNTILRHLHVWNHAASLALGNDKEWEIFVKMLQYNFKKGLSLNDFEKNFTKDLTGKELLHKWKDFSQKTAENFRFEDPKKRVQWVGPDMSVISSISARHMETWAHGQAIFDALGLERKNKDRIINIAIMGKNTFSWSYKVNNLEVPKQIPYLKLISPSGKIWEFNDKNSDNYIDGLAEEFCQVVTQVRNVKDLGLKVYGPISKEWMGMAQCFAGKAQTPPEPGIRKIMI